MTPPCDSIPKTTAKPARLLSVDAFRGFTVLAMIFAIQVAKYTDLPLTRSWFGSPPVSWFHHAGDAINATGVGLTFADLVAPFFVFIVGLVLPLSRQRRGSEWWRHVLARSGLLILLGVLYISLVLGLSYWWGILQAIGIAYCLGAASLFLPYWKRLSLVFLVLAFHLLMSHTVPWWLHLGNPEAPFLTISNLLGDPLRPLTVHCTPWASISYGAISVAGTLVGEALLSQSPEVIISQAMSLGMALTLIGYALHRYHFPAFAMNKDAVSASYALTTSGVSALTFVLFYLVIEVKQYRRWAWPLMVFGSNALLGYFLQPIVRNALFALGFKDYLAGHSGGRGCTTDCSGQDSSGPCYCGVTNGASTGRSDSLVG
jgi:predicted acyltransferase